ncbi:unnamed protein product [marine sediment metagenome]|uniref:Uncharacterized protein n=1 Tax=marine sediment metagenome TaxID=412755 RepID=X0S8R1_9ZZZZ
MYAFASLSMMVIGVVTLVVGVRLLIRAGQTRGLPELLFGAAFVTGSVGVAGSQLGQRFVWTEPGPLFTSMTALGFGLQVLGTAALFAVVWRVFRPRDRWAMGLASAGALLALGGWTLRWVDGSFEGDVLRSRGLFLFQSMRIVVFAWSATEALRYAAALRRRVAVGLAEPAVANQILFWGVAGIFMIVTTLSIMLPILLTGRSPLEFALPMALITVSTLGTAVVMWCAFFPPLGMRRRLLFSGA